MRSLMNNLEQFITDVTPGNIDPLIKMTVIHHQFESIHPFYDVNGRNGRIIKILCLVKHMVYWIPIALFFSLYQSE
ncbi:Fic family protein [Candidatus Protochlamydia amoebophila]|nr:Fic family protein [Candidatus Protochlamydia amoebophila]KIC73184.1 hypothetical protein DB44_BK00060 [Candidatus Protochlamydia amoebophila]